RARLASTQARCSASAAASPPKGLPNSQPAPHPITTVPSNRTAANPHACVAGCICDTCLYGPCALFDRTRLDGARREAITRAADRLYEAIVPEFLERLAQTADVHVDGAFLHVHVAAPDAIEQLIARVHALGVRHEELEHAVLGRPERDRARAHHHPMASLVRSEEHTSELQSRENLVCRLL